MQEESRALIPALPLTTQLAPNSVGALHALAGLDATPFYCSFDLSTQEGRKLLFAMDGEPTYEVRHMVKQRFKLQHLYAAPAEKVDEQGEVRALLRIVLVADDGKTYASFSKGIKETIVKLVGCYGQPPWVPPLEVEVYGIKTKHPGDLLKLRVIEPDAPASNKKGK